MEHTDQVEVILSKWREFKHAVPTNGAIILDETMQYVLLVQGFWSKISWGFPKGKVFEDESEANCAVREVLEETGYDITSKLNHDEYLQININEQTIRLYIITDVPKTTKFEPKTRGEIREVRWFAIDELPMHRKDPRTKHSLGYTANSFFMVIPFVKSLKQWISNKNGIKGLKKGRQVNRKRTYSHNLSTSNSSYSLYSQYNLSSQNHSLTHSQTNEDNTQTCIDSFNQSYKQISKSNDSITSLSNSRHQNQSSYKPSSPQKFGQNAFLKHFSNGFSQFKQSEGIISSSNVVQSTKTEITREEKYKYRVSSNQRPISPTLIKQQAQYYQKIQQDNIADLLSVKEAALSSKTPMNTPQIKILTNPNRHPQQQTNNNYQNSGLKLRQLNTNIMNSNKTRDSNSPTFSNMHSSPGNNHMNLNKKIQYNQNNQMNKENYFYQTSSLKTSNSFSNGFLPVAPIKKSYVTNIKTNILNNNNNGPDCWVNFKFDLDSIIQNLPPLVEF